MRKLDKNVRSTDISAQPNQHPLALSVDITHVLDLHITLGYVVLIDGKLIDPQETTCGGLGEIRESCRQVLVDQKPLSCPK